MYKKFENFLVEHSIPYKDNEVLLVHSNWKTGGPARLFIEPANAEQVGQLLVYLRGTEIPFVTIGYGTNILFDDLGYEGAVIKIGSSLKTMTFSSSTIVAETGVWVPCFARALASKGYQGLEHIAGIPGSLGGLIAMNGGSQRRAIGEHIVRVWTIDSGGDAKVYDKTECQFSYRSSIFQASDDVIVKAELDLEQGSVSTVRKAMLEILKSRRGKFPKMYPNCGSVFVSDPANYHLFGPPGMIIEKLGLKGMKKGNAQISPQHGNFIINLGDASSDDIQFLVRYVHQKVIEDLDIELKPEVKYLHPRGGLQSVL